MLENSNEYMNRNKAEILSIEIYKLYVGFSLSVKTEEIRSFWLYFRKTLSITEQNFYFVQLINLSFRGQITDRFGLLRRIYVVIYYCAVFLAQSLSVCIVRFPYFPQAHIYNLRFKDGWMCGCESDSAESDLEFADT